MLFLLLCVAAYCGSIVGHTYVAAFPPGKNCEKDLWVVARELGPVGACFQVKGMPSYWFTTYCGQEGHYGEYIVDIFGDNTCMTPLVNYSIPFPPDCTKQGGVAVQGLCNFDFPPDGIKFSFFDNSSKDCSQIMPENLILRQKTCVTTGEMLEQFQNAMPDVKSMLGACSGGDMSDIVLYKDTACLEEVLTLKFDRGQCELAFEGDVEVYVRFEEGCDAY